MYQKQSNNSNFKRMSKPNNLSVQLKKAKIKSLNQLKNLILNWNKKIKILKIAMFSQHKIKKYKMIKICLNKKKVKMMITCVFYIKSPQKSYVLLIFRKFVLNVQFLVSIKVMILKALRKLKSKIINFTMGFQLYMTKKQ